MRIYFWGWILRVAQKRTIKGAWQTWVPALLGDSGFSHRNCWGPRPLDPREAKTHSLESPLASDSRPPMSGLLWSLINLLTFLISAVLWVHKCICFILYYLLCTYVSMLVYHLWLRHCFEAPHPLSLVFCCSLSGERVVVSFCLKGKNPPVLLLLHQLPSLPYPLLPDGLYLGGRWRQCFCLHALPQKWFYGGWVSFLCSGSIWLRPELPSSSTHKPDHLLGPRLMASTPQLLLQTLSAMEAAHRGSEYGPSRCYGTVTNTALGLT